MSRERIDYPDYDVLAKWDTPSWDELTRDVIRRRLTEVPPRRFFTEVEWQTLCATCECLIPQPDRSPPVPLAPWIDDKLYRGELDGFRYSDMPPLEEAWRLGLQGIDEEGRRRFQRSFVSLPLSDRNAVLRAVQAGDVQGQAWSRLPAPRFFATILLKEVVGEYYAHPAAWSEVGFGGPASPRGYVRLGPRQRDLWEAPAARAGEALREP